MNSLCIDVLVGIALLIGICIFFYGSPLIQREEVIPVCSIPSSSEVSSFCESEGYENGYLSSNICGRNQVVCYMSVGEYVKTSCVPWTVLEEKK